MKTLLIDVDDTLYKKDSGPFNLVYERITSFVMELLGISKPDAMELRRKYISKYGSTLAGLMEDYNVDPGKYLYNVHDVPVEDMLKKDYRLHDTLAALAEELIVFTNGSYGYALRIVKALGVEDCFSGFFTIEDMDYRPKPLQYPYLKIMDRFGREAGELVVIDDRYDNVKTAIDLGMKGVLVGSEIKEGSLLMISDIYSIPDAIESLRSK